MAVRTGFILRMSGREADMADVRRFITATCIKGSYGIHSDGGIVCQLRFPSRHPAGWLLKQPGFSGSTIFSGDSGRLLAAEMTAHPTEWAWQAPKASENVALVCNTTNTSIDIDNTNIDNSSTDNSSTDNSTNNNFNLSVYLNETCRNAMNLEDFLEGIIAKFANIDYVNDRETWDYAEGLGMMSYTDGVIKLLKDELAKLPPNERPIQCSDRKRETFHIKKGGEWIVGSVDKHVKDALFDLGQTRVGYVIQWKRHNGGIYDDKKMDAARTRLMKNLLPGVATGSADRARNKIANAVAEQTMIDKLAVA